MVSGKFETGHVSECSGHENLPSGDWWAPVVIHDPQSRRAVASQRLSPHSGAQPCTGAAAPEKESRLHRTSPISMAAEVSNTKYNQLEAVTI